MLQKRKSQGDAGSSGNLSTVLFFVLRKKLPLIAAKPATNPATKPVITINKNELGPMPNNSPILDESKLSLALSIHQASPAHNKKSARNAERKALPAF